MTQISFYILEQGTPETAERFCCRLAEKTRASGQRIYIHVVDDTQAERLDSLMWTFSQNSFVPHRRSDDRPADDRRTPILIGVDTPPDDFNEVLISLGGDVQPFFSRFAQHHEVVAPDRRNEARAAYRFYRDRGYELTTHRISPESV